MRVENREKKQVTRKRVERWERRGEREWYGGLGRRGSVGRVRKTKAHCVK